MSTTKPRLYWVAHYTDGTTYRQGNYNDIDRSRLAAFCLYGDDDRLIAAIDFSDDNDLDLGSKRLIWRRRGMVSAGNEPIHVHLAGWQRTVNGVNVQSILYIREDTKEIVMGGQWQEDRPFMHGVILRDFER